jgi:GGDEF domain-containing protein
VPLTISAGAAVFPHDGESYEALLAKADSRMYRNKHEQKRDPHHHAEAAPAAPQELRKASGA